MWVQPLETANVRMHPAARAEVEPRLAVLLNANARKVSPKTDARALTPSMTFAIPSMRSSKASKHSSA